MSGTACRKILQKFYITDVQIEAAPGNKLNPLVASLLIWVC